MSKKTVVIYTDGACSGNPGPGGWAAVLVYGMSKKEISGYEKQTTNNRMELTGAIQALAALKEPCIVHLHSDSAYLVNAIQQHWLENWIRRGWKKADKSPVENADLWKELHALLQMHQVEFIKVAGHADVELNERRVAEVYSLLKVYKKCKKQSTKRSKNKSKNKRKKAKKSKTK